MNKSKIQGMNCIDKKFGKNAYFDLIIIIMIVRQKRCQKVEQCHF